MSNASAVEMEDMMFPVEAPTTPEENKMVVAKDKLAKVYRAMERKSARLQGFNEKVADKTGYGLGNVNGVAMRIPVVGSLNKVLYHTAVGFVRGNENILNK